MLIQTSMKTKGPWWAAVRRVLSGPVYEAWIIHQDKLPKDIDPEDGLLVYRHTACIPEAILIGREIIWEMAVSEAYQAADTENYRFQMAQKRAERGS